MAARRFAEAFELAGQLLSQGVEDFSVHAIRGDAAAHLGRAETALAAYREALRIRPSDAAVLYNAGTLAIQLREYQTAEQYLAQAYRRQPQDRDILESLGVAKAQLGHHAEAESLFRKLMSQFPEYAGGYLNLAIVQGLGRCFDDALQNLARAVELEGETPQILLNRAMILLRHGHADEAIGIYRRLTESHPGERLFLEGLEAVHAAVGDWAEAARMAARVRELASGDKAALCRQAYATARAGDLEAALALLEQQAAADDPDILDAYAKCYTEYGLVEEAVDCYRKILEQRPADREAVMASTLLRLYLPGEDEHVLLAGLRRAMNPAAGEIQRRLPRARERKPLRVGFVSADLRQHSVASFIEPVFRHIDPARIEVHVYDNGRYADSVTTRLQALVPHWRYIETLPDARVAQMIADDEIDVLVDLSGLTAGNRLGVFALKPAPVQVTWLGYPGTTGLEHMDYRLTDALSDPPGQTETFYSERLWRLPEIFSVFQPPDESPVPVRSPCLRNGYVTFGSFNNYNKLNQQVLALWARLLRQVPGSRLLLKSFALTHAPIRDRLIAFFEARDVPHERIRILPPTARTAEHLACYGEIDIALDTFPYCGTTTTCEALWMGVPVISLVGNTHRARVGLTQLQALGLAEFAVDSEVAYLQKAAGLAGDVEKLDALRNGMRERMQDSALLDAPRFVRHLEQAFEAMSHSPVIG